MCFLKRYKNYIAPTFWYLLCETIEKNVWNFMVCIHPLLAAMSNKTESSVEWETKKMHFQEENTLKIYVFVIWFDINRRTLKCKNTRQ